MDAEAKGYRMGWDDAKVYATGSKVERAAIRRRLAKANRTFGNPFWTEYHRALTGRAEAYGVAIREGRLPRTIRPTKLFALGR